MVISFSTLLISRKEGVLMFKKIFAFLLINILLMSLAILNHDIVFESAENNNLLPTVDSFRASTYESYPNGKKFFGHYRK